MFFRNNFNQFIQGLRQSRGGSLSGMSMQDIITQVSAIITQHDSRQKSKSQVHTCTFCLHAYAICCNIYGCKNKKNMEGK